MRAQVSVEFLFSVSIMLIMLLLSIAIYVSNLEETAEVRDGLEATRICMLVASSAGAAAASGANTTTQISLPKYISGQNYTVHIAGSKNTVRVSYLTFGIGCQFPEMNITNSSGATLFMVARNATMNYYGGAVVVSP